VDVEVITNGFDPDDAPVPAAVAAAPLTPGKVSLVHTGGLGGERTLAPLLEALAQVARDGDTGLAERVELVLAGSRTAGERELYERPELRPFVRHIGFLEREEALALQRAADWLVLVTSGKRTGEATGKLFEYLASGRPILTLGAGSAAGDIVAGAQRGIVIPTHDRVAAEGALRRILAGEQPLSANGSDGYLYPALAARYEQVLEQAIAARR
jgi:glycosyltransferase involved in cell wall biosynthesis